MAYFISPWFLLLMELDAFGDLRAGASWLAVLVGVAAMALGVLPALAPLLASLAAIGLMVGYDLTERRMREVRAELEARRASTAAAGRA